MFTPPVPDDIRLHTVIGLDDNGHEIIVLPADRESLKCLGRMTQAEQYAVSLSEAHAEMLEQDRPAFDELLAETMINQRGLVERIRLDQDEAEVLAVIELLLHVGPRRYLNFLDEANKKRLRNAWDRFDRKRNKPEWTTLFRQALREFACKTRHRWHRERRAYEAEHDRKLDQQDWGERESDETDTALPLPEIQPFDCTCGAVDSRFCTCRNRSSPIGGEWSSPPAFRYATVQVRSRAW